MATLIAVRLPRRLLLGATVIAFELLLGVLAGTVAALRRGTRTESLVLGATFVGISTSTFLSGKLLLVVVAY